MRSKLGAQHALLLKRFREWISPAAVAYIAYRLLENAGAHLDMLNEYDFYLMPLVNPDG